MKKHLFLRSAVILLLAWLSGASVLMAQVTFSATGLPASIPDPGSVSKTITVSGLTGNVATANEIQVSFAIDHGWAGDIKVGVTPPGGTEIIIVNTIGSGNQACYSNNNFLSNNVFTISQSATGQIPDAGRDNGYNIPGGTYLPTGCVNNSVGSLASLVGFSRNGD